MIYAQAGFAYEYAASEEVFDGIDSFERILTPQAGDLIVWQGHMGVVLDPVQHSFYSSVRAGFAIEDYRSAYWRARGVAHFYRYKITTQQIEEVDDSQLFPPVKPPAASANRSQRQESVDVEAATAITSGARSDMRRSKQSAQASKASMESPGATLISNSISNPSLNMIFVSAHRRPSRQEIQAAVLRSVTAQEDNVQAASALNPSTAAKVAEEFTVEQISLRESSGWADLKIRETASLQYGQENLIAVTRWLRADLRRGSQGWSLEWPADHIYLSRDRAVKVLADRLAAMSTKHPDTTELRKVVKVLDGLLAE